MQRAAWHSHAWTCSSTEKPGRPDAADSLDACTARALPESMRPSRSPTHPRANAHGRRIIRQNLTHNLQSLQTLHACSACDAAATAHERKRCKDRNGKRKTKEPPGKTRTVTSGGSAVASFAHVHAQALRGSSKKLSARANGRAARRAGGRLPPAARSQEPLRSSFTAHT